MSPMHGFNAPLTHYLVRFDKTVPDYLHINDFTTGKLTNVVEEIS